MTEQVSIDKTLKDPTDKIKAALAKAIFVKSKIYINADAHTFQPDIIEIFNLLADALNICTDNIICDPYQRVRQSAIIYKEEYEKLKRLDENVKKLINDLTYCANSKVNMAYVLNKPKLPLGLMNVPLDDVKILLESLYK